MYYLEESLSAFVTVLALALTIISYLSYRKRGVRKLLYITMGFALFFIQGLVLSAALVVENVNDNLHLSVALLNSLILLILYLSVVR